MSHIYRDHCSEIALDFGVIGDQYVDIIYDWHEANPSNDPMQVPEPSYPDIKDVLLFIDGREASIKHWIAPSQMTIIEEIIREQWL